MTLDGLVQTMNSAAYVMAAYSPEMDFLVKTEDHPVISGQEIAQSGANSHAKSIQQNDASIEQFKSMYNSYVDSGNHSAFNEWCSRNGYGTVPKFPNEYASSSHFKDAVAWTSGNKDKPMIGVNKYLDSKLKEFAGNYGLTKQEAAELTITHELFHMMQNDYVKKNGVHYTETDCEKNLTKYFLERAGGSKNKDEAQKYWKMAKATSSRYKALSTALGKEEQKKASALEQQLYAMKTIIENGKYFSNDGRRGYKQNSMGKRGDYSGERNSKYKQKYSGKNSYSKCYKK